MPFDKVANGVPGLEVRLPLLFSEGVGRGRISLNRFVDVAATAAAKLYGLYPRKGTIAVGADADIAIWDPEKKVKISQEMLHDNMDYTPYEGREVTGWPVITLSRGQVVWRGGRVLGLCGGYQILGRTIKDPEGVEGGPGEAEGLGLLDIETELSGGKTLVEAGGVEVASGQAVRGYEMHVGATSGPDLARPLLRLGDRPEGAVSADGRVMGCYLHGLFAADGFRHAFLNRIRTRQSSGLAYEAEVEGTLDELADHLEAHMKLERLLEVARAA